MSIFGTVYEPRNFACVSRACSTWQEARELVPSISTSGDVVPNLPALAGSTMSQLSVTCLPVLIPPWKMMPRGSLALRPRSKPFQWSIWWLPGKKVSPRPMKLFDPATVPTLWLKKSAV